MSMMMIIISHTAVMHFQPSFDVLCRASFVEHFADKSVADL